jgi:hypothetical protein
MAVEAHPGGFLVGRKLIGLGALVLFACGSAEELAAEMADGAGEFLEDAGIAIADAGRELVDAGAKVDSSAQAMDDVPAYDDEPVLAVPDASAAATRDAGTVADASTVTPTPPAAALTVTASCDTIYGGRTADGWIDDLEYYAEVKLGQQDPSTFAGATAWMCKPETLASFKDPRYCSSPGCIPQHGGNKLLPTCQAGIVEVTSGNSGGTFARVKCGFRRTNPGVYDYGERFTTVKITIAL